VLAQYSPGGTEENHEKLDQNSQSPGPRFENGTSGIRSRIGVYCGDDTVYVYFVVS
jgi:hypothetical protein